MLSNALPGFSQVSPGNLNGPISSQMLSQLAQGSQSDIQTFNKDISSGLISGYIRTWAANADSSVKINIEAVQFPSTSSSATAFSGFVSAMQSAGSSQNSGSSNTSIVSKISVPSIPGAAGIEELQTDSSGNTTVYIIGFQSGVDMFAVSLHCPVSSCASSGIDTNSSIQLADNQYAAVAGSPSAGPSSSPADSKLSSNSLAYSIGGILFLVIIVALVVLYFIQRSKRSAPSN